MVLISNNCLAGFIYKKILNEPYSSPFIFTLIDPNEYVDLIENFENVNFENWELVNTSKELSNNFQIIIDGKYHLLHQHFHFDKKYNVPTKISAKYVDIHYNKIWEYICERYIRHIERMKSAKDFRFFYLEPNLKCDRLLELPEIFKKKKMKGMIFTKTSMTGNEYTKIVQTGLYDPSEVVDKFTNEIKEFLS